MKSKKVKKPLTPEELAKLKRNIKRRSIGLGITFLICTAAVLICYFFVGWIYRVDANDMYPNIQDGDLVVYKKQDKYYARDIVVYEYNSQKYIGRIFGVEGDTVEIRPDAYLMLNGSLPFEVNVFYPTLPGSEELKYPLTVQPNKVFIMGDYRTDASDSRRFGEIDVANIKGKVILLLLRYRGLVS